MLLCCVSLDLHVVSVMCCLCWFCCCFWFDMMCCVVDVLVYVMLCLCLFVYVSELFGVVSLFMCSVSVLGCFCFAF